MIFYINFFLAGWQDMKQSKKIKAVFTGGGTGGHVYPGLAVIEALIESGAYKPSEIAWIGNKKGIERRIIEKAGYNFISIPAGKLRRYFSLKNFTDIFKVIGGVFKSFFVLARLKPDFVFSKGGFVTVPPILAARVLRIRCATHESDATPGLATKINSRFVNMVFTAYDSTAGMISKKDGMQIIVSGNPVRKEIKIGDVEKGRSFAGISDSKKIMLVLGGSLGAKQVNDLIEKKSRSSL
jgi:UDP-N-acetylglucosamine--N-acetylmuramyl-(pentapeptide) pyrophosphoryl-undecaprenol N-acetylglucosamine transferase